MSTIWLIARMSVLENARKQVFHVLCLLMLTVIVGATLLSIFTEGVRLKILKDLCMTGILLGGGVLAIALGASGVPNDIESRTIQPIMARPVTRTGYLLGKFFGTLATTAIGVLAMAIVFGALIAWYQRAFDPFLLTAILFTLLEVAIIAAVATALSTLAGPAVSAALTFVIYLLGTVKMGYLGGLMERASEGISRAGLSLVYHALPNLECFNLKTALVHHDPIPHSYLAQVAVYGVCYAAFALFVGSMIFARREM